MFHGNVKFYFKVIYPIEAHYITGQIVSLFWEPIIVYANGGSWALFS